MSYKGDLLVWLPQQLRRPKERMPGQFPSGAEAGEAFCRATGLQSMLRVERSWLLIWGKIKMYQQGSNEQSRCSQHQGWREASLLETGGFPSLPVISGKCCYLWRKVCPLGWSFLARFVECLPGRFPSLHKTRCTNTCLWDLRQEIRKFEDIFCYIHTT